MVAAWDPWQQQVERSIDAGENGVVVLLTLRAQGGGSGVPVEFHWAMVMVLRGGRITTSRVFLDQNEALKAVGLEEEAMAEENVGLGTPTDAEAKARAYFERFNENGSPSVRRCIRRSSGIFARTCPTQARCAAMGTSRGGTFTGSRRSGTFTSSPSR
jgi:hypothetical protein